MHGGDGSARLDRVRKAEEEGWQSEAGCCAGKSRKKRDQGTQRRKKGEEGEEAHVCCNKCLLLDFAVCEMRARRLLATVRAGAGTGGRRRSGRA